MAASQHCVVCNQPWPEVPYRSSKEQQRRVSAACGAEGGIDAATRDIEHLLFAALRLLRDETKDGTSEEDLKWTIATLVEYAQGACEELKERTEALWGVTADYLWPTHREARKAAQLEEVEASAKEQQE